MRTLLSYGFAALLPLLTLSAPLKAETDIVANGALNFFFPHGAVSLALGQPVYTYQKSHQHQYVPEYRKSYLYQHNDRHDHKYRYAPEHFIVIEKPSRHHAEYKEHPRQNYQARQYQNHEWKYSKYRHDNDRSSSKKERHSQRNHNEYRHEQRH